MDRPAIYYGDGMTGYRIVATGVKELDYPKGNENVYADYSGDGGILLDSFWKRVLFAWSESDINILLTSYLDPESRIQIWRRIRDRVSGIVPFLELEGDPYLVLSEGKLYWIQDAYTVSADFPYSEPNEGKLGTVNYVGNSVKVVEDAYNGSVRLFVMDPEDPLLKAYRRYRRAFPGVFRKLSELSGDLKQHLRYPEDLFTIQADMYKTYHMTDPQVFYNQEDLWTSSDEKYTDPLPKRTTKIHELPHINFRKSGLCFAKISKTKIRNPEEPAWTHKPLFHFFRRGNRAFSVRRSIPPWFWHLCR